MLTDISNPPVELQSVGQPAGWLVGLHPLARVGGQVALARTSVVEKPAARDVIVVAAQRAADRASRLADEIRRRRKTSGYRADALVPFVPVEVSTFTSKSNIVYYV